MSAAGGPYAAVDLGASSGRVVVGRLVDHAMVTHEVARFENTPTTDDDGVLRWDLAALWRGVRDGLDKAADDGAPASVGIDTWAVDYGLLDGEGRLLGAPVHYRDTRTSGVPDRLFAHLAPARHYAITGAQVQPFNTVFQLLTEGERLASASRVALVPDLLAHLLGGAAVTEVTNASTTGLLDVRARRWSTEVLQVASELAGHELAPLLGRLVEPGTVVGEVDPAASARAVLAAGPPVGAPAEGAGDAATGARIVAVGSHDTASAVLAVPMTRPSTAAYISSGTWSLVGLELDAPVLTSASRAANHSNELGVAGTVRYLKNVAGMWLLSESQRVWRAAGQRAELRRLLAAAARAEPRRTVIDVGDPVFLPPGDMPARIADLARATGQPVPRDPGEFTRCILDSLAAAYRNAIDGLAAAADRQVEVIHVVGGGARNRLLCQLTADATGLPVVAGPAEGAALGNLLVQAAALGDVPADPAALREIVRRSVVTETFEPRP